jgi:hypothetical protein
MTQTGLIAAATAALFVSVGTTYGKQGGGSKDHEAKDQVKECRDASNACDKAEKAERPGNIRDHYNTLDRCGDMLDKCSPDANKGKNEDGNKKNKQGDGTPRGEAKGTSPAPCASVLVKIPPAPRPAPPHLPTSSDSLGRRMGKL